MATNNDMLKRFIIQPVCFLLICSATALAAPPDFTGYWRSLIHEDYMYRFDGPLKGDYHGLPLTEKARKIADTWDPDEWEKPEEQCKPHGAAYIMRGPGVKQIIYENDGNITLNVELDGQVRNIYMDGRPWPGGELQWQGHSIGKWEGDTLTVRTTHIRPRYIRRNGVYHTADVVMTEHFVRHGDYLTVITILVDPEVLTEPLVRSISMVKMDSGYQMVPWECFPIEWPKGVPGDN